MTQTVLLGDIIKKGDLTIHNKLRAPLNSRQRTEKQGGYPYYGATGRMDSIDEYKFDGLYVLVAEDGTVYGKNGVCPMIQRVRGKFWVSNHAHVLQGKDAIDTQYLALALEASDVRANITGAVQLKLSKDNLFKLKIYWPDRDEREAILNAIYPIDEKIELNRQMNETLEQMGQALFRHYFIDNPEAEKWEAVQIGDITTLVSRGISPKYDENGSSLVINQRCIRNGRLSLDSARRQSKAVADDKILKNGDILINSTGVGTLGRVAQVDGDMDNVTADSHVTIARPSIDTYFFGQMMRGMESVFENMGRGSTGQTELSRAAVSETKVKLPPSDMIKDFSDKIAPVREQMLANDKEIQTLTTLRDTLLPQLIGGKMEV